MYSCDQGHTATRTTATMPCSTKYQRCNTASTARTLRNAGDRVPGDAQAPPRSPRRRHSTVRGASSSSSRRSSTTVVATDVTNFRAMVQELTGFPQAAIFRPLPRRVHAAGPLAGVRGCGGTSGGGGGGGALHGHGSDAAIAAGNSSPDVPAAQPLMHPPQCAPPGVFDGLADLGSPDFGAWADLSFE